MNNSKSEKKGNCKIRVENNTGMKGFTIIQNHSDAKNEKMKKHEKVFFKIFDFLKIIIFITLPILLIRFFSKKQKV